MLIRLLVLLALLLPGSAAVAQEAATAALPPLPNVIDARVTSTPERARLVVDLAGRTEFAMVTLSDPDRIAIDDADIGGIDRLGER